MLGNLRGLTDSEGSDTQHYSSQAPTTNQKSQSPQQPNYGSQVESQNKAEYETKVEEQEYSEFASPSPQMNINEEAVATTTSPAPLDSNNITAQQEGEADPVADGVDEINLAEEMEVAPPQQHQPEHQEQQQKSNTEGSKQRKVGKKKTSVSPARRNGSNERTFKTYQQSASRSKIQQQQLSQQQQQQQPQKKEKNPKVPEQKQTAHQKFISQVDPNDLQAQVFVRQMQNREREIKQQRIAEMGGVAANPQAVEQQRIIMEMQSQEANQQNQNYMMMQNPGQQQFVAPAQGPLGALRQVKDSKKNEWQLSTEVNLLKQQRNRDMEHIKILKVELQKLELLFKKYKECLSPDSIPQVQLENLPSLITMAQQPNMIDTEVLLMEIHRIKQQLQQEINIQKYARDDATDIASARKKLESTKITSVGSAQNQASSPSNINNNEQRSIQQSRVGAAKPVSDVTSQQQQFNPRTYQVQNNQDGAAKSTLRLQLGNLKKKTKELESQLGEKDVEIQKMKEKTSEKAQEGIKDELRRAYDVLKHLKKKVGSHAFNEEYSVVMSEIREALEMPPMQTAKGRKMRKPKPIKLVPQEQESQELMADDDGDDDGAVSDTAGDEQINKVAEDLGEEKEVERSLDKEDAAKDPTSEQQAKENDPLSDVGKKEETEETYQLPGTDNEKEPEAQNNEKLSQDQSDSKEEEPTGADDQKKDTKEPTQEAQEALEKAEKMELSEKNRGEDDEEDYSPDLDQNSANGEAEKEEQLQEEPQPDKNAQNETESPNLSEEEEGENKHQEEIDELEAKLSDLQAELNMSQEEFENRLLKRLQQEIKINQQQLEGDLRQEVALEKKRILQATNQEKNVLKVENTKLQKEIHKLKILLRGTEKL